MYSESLHAIAYRALVTYSNSSTGEIRVRIPSVSGIASDLPISFIGRKKRSGSWVVPAIGEQIVVTADDANLSNVFWMHVDTYEIRATPDYGSFYDTQTQTNPVINTPRAMKLRNTAEAHNVSVVNDSQIKVSYGGVYNLQFSAQLDKTDSGEDHVDIWFRKNGMDVTWSDTRMTMPKNDAKLVASWNFVLTLADNDYVEIMWLSDDQSMRLYAEGAHTAPDHPGIPSVIATITRVV